jgi:uncharacterized cofD-like protein
LRIVAIGGGTGLSTLLKGLKRYSSQSSTLYPSYPALLDITAVVTVTDDGGSSGRLRRDFAILPPGDIRNCMVALSEDESLLTQVFNYRFDVGRGLKGHSLGNLFLTALTRITGDFAHAVRLSSEVLAISGRIFPSTSVNVSLRAHLADGSTVDGESRISRSSVPIDRLELIPASPKPMEDTLHAIGQADLITLGPGSLFTSIIPNLLVRGIPEAIRKSRALTAALVNLMWQPGETTGFSASDHLRQIIQHAGKPGARQRMIDYAVVNTEPIADELLISYARNRAMQVANDIDQLRQLGVEVVGLPLLAHSEKVRHDPDKLARITVELAKKGRRRILRQQMEKNS